MVAWDLTNHNSEGGALGQGWFIVSYTSQTHMHYILQPDWSLVVISKFKGIYTVNKICY